MSTRALSPELVSKTLSSLSRPSITPQAIAPAPAKQPIHTVYGGAHLFRADTPAKLGAIASQGLERYAPDFASLAHAVQMPGFQHLTNDYDDTRTLQRAIHANPTAMRRSNRVAWVAYKLRERIVEKLAREPIEDFRIDFEDGYGVRSDEEEDGHAATVAAEIARGMAEKLLPRRLGIRIKSLDDSFASRALRTLDIVVSELCAKTGGKVPSGFVVTLPKVSSPAQVTALADVLDVLESSHSLAPNTIRMELMIEHPRAIFTADGVVAIPSLVAASRGRVAALHLGAYDLTANLDIISTHQTMMHPACDFARMVMSMTMARSGIWLSDGATIDLPIEVHPTKPGTTLSPTDEETNRLAIHRAWKLSYEHISHSLRLGFYQGWDLHPAQLVPRYAATYTFFLDGMEAAGPRLRRFLDEAARATQSAGSFDDAATGQGLLNFFLRAESSGALTAEEVHAETGLRPDELESRSFGRIVEIRCSTKH